VKTKRAEGWRQEQKLDVAPGDPEESYRGEKPRYPRKAHATRIAEL
jgi:hypothetical protein